uniref:Uncharacterized protein n=1 Tax=Pseudo-nitzschia australis TaxID=44445 RepID=A0A6U9VT09_9STRA|mmetsp:Transcript_8304/g.17939  ORF Transcript_8304/g.17939 Transcript_8304/m.17939 type:complete len:224 (+) Transcript_8304:194-865(+)|eukprot:CAMPEP_0168168468 /NCGR_PEP_ID=MMETSP0139_2-20121125/3108_1 /TAXON_ID=44445 /ORGANISM="Pseudo-nitzschia australis, Strain 10249 10 AB" /LENGTH=223 /DNA_ID=CAMNT_0008085797 /DNA_START=142 /DNA_END=813 /DNA_ORIENTATION=-
MSSLSYSSSLLVLVQFIIGFLQSPLACQAWVCHSPSSITTRSSLGSPQSIPRQILSSSTSSTEALSVGASDDDEDDEYEYVEYEILTESEFLGSEWLIGTVMDNNLNKEKIAETWVRLATDKDGKNLAVWGDNSEGNWNFDVASQFLSMSKNSIVGKNIWAGVVDDYYFCRGSVRGWNFFSPASVVGQWQAKRLGVEKDEAGVAPWFDEEDETLPLADTTEGQ